MNLRVATHGELTASGHPERSDRDSHDVPQFLLVEFFRNRNANEKAWPAPIGGNAADTGYGKALGMVKSSKLGLIDSVRPGGHTFRLKDPLDKKKWKDALRDVEKPYYEGLAAALGKVDGKDNLLAAYELKTSMINNVVKKVEDKNTSVMTDW